MKDFKVTSDKHSADIEVVGENARERMKEFLSMISPELDGEVEYMRVQLRTEQKEIEMKPEPELEVEAEPETQPESVNQSEKRDIYTVGDYEK